MEVISTVPEIEPAKFESLINSSMQVRMYTITPHVCIKAVYVIYI